jgi:hypothetical protein
MKEIVCEGVKWIQRIQKRDNFSAVLNMKMNFRFHERWGIFMNSCVNIKFSRRTLFHGVSKLPTEYARRHGKLNLVGISTGVKM